MIVFPVFIWRLVWNFGVFGWFFYKTGDVDAHIIARIFLQILVNRIAQTEQDIVSISTPFWESEKFYRAGIEYYQSLTELLPERWWLYHNIGGLAERLGEEEIAKEALARSEELKGRD